MSSRQPLADLQELAIAPVAAPLRRQLENRLRAAILDGRFAPGTRLVERELCALFNVSRTSMREALRQLEAEGLAQGRPYKGLVVAGVSAAEAQQVYEVRAVLEALAGRGFVERASDEQVSRLKRCYQELVNAARTKHFQTVLDVKEAFYGILMDGCGNLVAKEILMQLNNRVRFLRAMSLSAPSRLPRTLAEVKKIVQAVAARDADAAAEACVRHVQMAATAAMRALKKNRAEDQA